MANFNLADYETVEQRIARFYSVYPDGRILTENLTTKLDRQVSTWVVKATVYLTKEDQDSYCPKANGLAFEVDGTGMANKTSALENCETSAIGRALANAGFSGNKRTSREEMEKVKRDVTPKAPVAKPEPTKTAKHFNDLGTMAAQNKDIDTLRELYAEAVADNQPKKVLDSLTELAKQAK